MSDLHLVTMPKWGLSMEEGSVVAWHKDVGDTVEKGDALIDVETTKITNTIEAPATGRLLKVLAETGVIAVCGSPLAVIGDGGAGDAEIEQFVADHGGRAEQAEGTAADQHAEPNFADVNDEDGPVRIRYLDTGAGAETVVLIHGFGGDLDNWMMNQPVLARDYRVIAIDLPGHGGSDKRVGDGAATTFATLIATLLDDIAPGPVHIVAHSFGAIVARALASADRDRILSFTAIAPADLGQVARAYIDGFIGARRRSDLATAIGMLFADPSLVTREMAEALLRYKRLDGVEEALRTIDAANFSNVGPDEAATAFWRELGPRGLLVWGELDAVVALSSTPTHVSAIATRVIGSAGHMPHLEKPDAVNAAIASHVAEFAAGGSANVSADQPGDEQ